MSKLRHSTRGNREAQQTQRPRLIHHVDISSPVEKSTSVVASIFQKSSRLPIPSLPIGEKKKKTKEKENRGGKEKRTEKKSAFHSSEISDRVERARRKIISQTSHRFPVPHRRRYARNEESRKGEPSYFRQIFTPTILSTCTRSQRPEPPTPPSPDIFRSRVIMQGGRIHVDFIERFLAVRDSMFVVSSTLTDRWSRAPLIRLIYCRFRGMHGGQMQQGTLFPWREMLDYRRRHGCMSLPPRIHRRPMRDQGRFAGKHWWKMLNDVSKDMEYFILR